MTLNMRGPVGYVAAAAVFVALLVIAWPVLYPSANPVQQSSNGAVATNGPLPVVPVVDLNLDRLRNVGGELPASERDPFRFRPKPPPPAPRVQAPPVVFTPPVPTGPPPPPPIPLKFIGTLEKGGKKWAIFSDGSNVPRYATEGELVLGQYKVVRIGVESVVMEYADGKGRQTIPMRGQ